jgi:hypothetical protein
LIRWRLVADFFLRTDAMLFPHLYIQCAYNNRDATLLANGCQDGGVLLSVAGRQLPPALHGHAFCATVPARDSRTLTSTREPSRLPIDRRRSTVKQIRIVNTREVGRSNTNAAVRSTYRQVFPIERP